MTLARLILVLLSVGQTRCSQSSHEDLLEPQCTDGIRSLKWVDYQTGGAELEYRDAKVAITQPGPLLQRPQLLQGPTAKPTQPSPPAGPEPPPSPT